MTSSPNAAWACIWPASAASRSQTRASDSSFSTPLPVASRNAPTVFATGSPRSTSRPTAFTSTAIPVRSIVSIPVATPSGGVSRNSRAATCQFSLPVAAILQAQATITSSACSLACRRHASASSGLRVTPSPASKSLASSACACVLPCAAAFPYQISAPRVSCSSLSNAIIVARLTCATALPAIAASRSHFCAFASSAATPRPIA